MSIILYGVTSGGTSVPIEVTPEGKLVVDTSKFPTDEFIKQGDDIEAGNITAAGDIKAGNGTAEGTIGAQLFPSGGITARNVDPSQQVFGGYKPGDSTPTFSVTGNGSITAGSITANSSIKSSPPENADGFVMSGGGVDLAGIYRDSGGAIIYANDSSGTASIYLDGRNGGMSVARSNAGFTSDGELYFYSRNVRYKAVVQAGNMMAEEYTRATELQQKAQRLKDQARQPKTQDIVPED